MSWRPTYRGSKFRNVYGKVGNREHCYDGIPITKNVHDNHFCAVNSKFVAVVTESAGGGSFIVIPVSQVSPPMHLRHIVAFSVYFFFVLWEEFFLFGFFDGFESCTSGSAFIKKKKKAFSDQAVGCICRVTEMCHHEVTHQFKNTCFKVVLLLW